MRTFVRTTPRYDQEAKAHHCANVVARFRQRAEQSQNEEFPGERFRRFPGNYFKKQHENFRTIYTYEERKILGQDVRCFVALCVFPRGNTEYERFYAPGSTVAERAKITDRDQVNWPSIWQEIEVILTSQPPPEPLPKLDGNEVQFIDRDAGLLQTVFDYPIYETKGWVDQTSGSSFEDPFKVAEALDGVIMAVESDETLNKKTIPLTSTPYGIQGADEANRKSIEYCRLQDKDGRFAWFLIGLGTPEELQRSREALGKIALPKEGLPDFDRLANACRRAYPYDMINDKDRWAEMERDRDGNFVLSEEELRIVSGPVQFPLFVTGRAGSGKSTMLQYLFADFFFRYLERRDSELGSILPPVYLSYSDNLVQNAQHLAEVLFEKNHVFQKQLSNLGLGFANDIKPLIPGSFLTFQRMVRRCIEEVNPEAGTTRFRPENHISYARFRSMWMKTFGRDRNAFRDFGPELSWHVIRTYIKGWDSESYCEPEDYDEIGVKNQSVTPEVFRNIFNRIWPWYQKLQEDDSLWDDQDLVRYCLAPDDDVAETCVSERFSAIFCDESQDFTRIETDLILRLSTFAHRRIDEKWLKKLPFVFAGDEFQTLNPTGFSWDSLRAYFTERLCKSIQRTESFAAPDPINLKKNYRSTPPVVRLANRLQLLRQTRCNTGTNAEPQEPFDTDANAEPVFCLDARDQDVWDRLVESHVSLIIPCADGQTPKDFLEKSPAKGKLVFYDDGTPQGITVYNPIQAKGLEYPSVAIYGFENEMPFELGIDALLQWFDRKSNKEPSAATEIGLKYFLSNAYVSATRAKQKLFILGDFSPNSFWAFAFAEPNGELLNKASTLEKRMLGTLRNPDEWTSSGNANGNGDNGYPNGRNCSKLGYILKGDIDNLSAGFVDANTAAKTTESRALSLLDPGLMRQAAARYRELGDAKGEKRCEAYANLYESHYEVAGQLFLEANEADEAVSALWRSLDKSLNEATLRQLAGIRASQRPEKRMANLCLRDSLTIRAFTQSVLELLQILDNNARATKERDFVLLTASVWQSVLSAMLAKIPRVAANDANAVRELLAHAKRADGYGISVSSQKRASIAYGAGLLREAVELWKKAEKSNSGFVYPSEYHIALAKTDSYPATLLHWWNSKAGNWARRVLDSYKENRNSSSGPLPEEIRRIVGEAAMKDGDRDVLSVFLPRILAKSTSVPNAAESIRQAFSIGMEINGDALLNLVRYKLGEQLELPDLKEDSAHSVRNFYAVLRASLKMRNSETRNDIKKKLEHVSAEDIVKQYLGDFYDNRWNSLLLFETGRLFESSELEIRNIEGAKYYACVAEYAKEDWMRKELDKRRIVCLEKQLETSQNPDPIKKDIKTLRLKLFQEGSLESELENIPSSPEFNWILYFMEVVGEFPKEAKPPSEDVGVKSAEPPSENIGVESAEPPPASAPASERTPSGETEPPAPEPEQHETPEPIPQPAAASRFFDYSVSGLPEYSFRYKPGVELVFSCKTDQDDLRMRFRSAKFPEGGDFVLSEGKLFSEDGRETPFDVEIGSGSVRFRIRESGIELIFPLSS